MGAAAKDGFDVTVCMDKLFGFFHVLFDAREALKIGFDVIACFTTTNAQLVCKAERGNAVDDAEIDRFCTAANAWVHALNRHTKHLACCHGVNVEPVRKRLFELRNIGHMGEHTQFNLAVIGRNELFALPRDKRLTDFAAFRGSDRDVLDVWLGGGQTARGGGRQRERGVDAARLLINEAWQGVRVGGFQLAELAPLYNFAWQLMALRSEIIQHGS